MSEQQRIAGTPPKPDMTITRDRNHPGTVSWLDCCRSMRRDLSNAEFEERIHEFITLGLGLQERRHQAGLQ